MNVFNAVFKPIIIKAALCCAISLGLPCVAMAVEPAPLTTQANEAQKAQTPEAQPAGDRPVIVQPVEVEVPDYRKASTDRAILDIVKLLKQKKDFKKAALACQRLIEAFPQSDLKQGAYYELGYLHWRLGEVKEAKAVLDDILSGTAVDTALKTRAGALVDEIDSALFRATHEENIPSIGVVLALKGVYAPYGEAALNGTLLASGIFAKPSKPNEKDRRMAVYVRDVGDEPQKTADAVKELSSKANVLGVVGPLISAGALEAAVEAQNSGIPIITLTQKEGVTSANNWAFRNSMTLANQASALASYAVSTLGLKRFAVIFPQNAYGEKMATLFGMDAQLLGASVLSLASYDEGTTDFSAVIKQAFKINVKKRKEGRRTIKEYEPKLQVDAVFIPDYYDAVGMLLPYFEYLNVQDVRVIGASGLNSSRFVSMAGKAAEGAVFLDSFFALSARQGATGFVSDFKEAFGAQPGAIEAASYDSALALRTVITTAKDGASVDRGFVRDGLKSLKGLVGAEGELSFDANNEAVKKPFFLTIKDGRIIEAGQ